MSVVYGVLLSIAWGGLNLALAYLVAPPRIELAARLANAPGPESGSSNPMTGCARVVRLAIQSQQIADTENLTITARLNAGARFEPSALRGYLGTANDRRGVSVVLNDDMDAATVTISRLRGLKTMFLELGCCDASGFVVGHVEGLRRTLSAVVAAGAGGLVPLGGFRYEWRARHVTSDDDGIAAVESVEPWGSRFPNRPLEDAKVFILGAIIGVLTFVVVGLAIGVEFNGRSGSHAIAAAGILVAIAALVFAAVLPRRPAIAQGFFEPFTLRASVAAAHERPRLTADARSNAAAVDIEEPPR